MTSNQLKTCFAVLTALHEAIQASGKQGIPSGHLYAMLMGKVGLSQYQQLIGILVKAGKVTDHGHLLKATVPFENVQAAPDMAAFEIGGGK